MPWIRLSGYSAKRSQNKTELTFRKIYTHANPRKDWRPNVRGRGFGNVVTLVGYIFRSAEHFDSVAKRAADEQIEREVTIQQQGIDVVVKLVTHKSSLQTQHQA